MSRNDYQRRRSFQDRAISLAGSLACSISEPVKLRLARIKYAAQYCTMDEPLVSVYIPTYNRAELLIGRAVTSVLGQTYGNIEIIIVGDCCTDATEALIRKIGDPRIRFYNLPKRTYRYPPTAENHWLAGPVVPSNKALDMVRGKWIARIDDDDVWTPTHIVDLLRFAQKGGYEFVSAQYIEERLGRQAVIDGERAGSSYYNPGGKDDKGGDSPKIGGTQTWLYRSYLRFFRYNINCWRKAWNRVNDVDISVRIFKAGVRMGFLDKVEAYVLPRPGETTVGVDAYRAMTEDKIARLNFST